MNKRLLYLLIAGICVSLLGIGVVQFFWIRNALHVKESQFSRSVNDALSGVVTRMEARENMSFISRNFEGDSIMRIVQAFTRDTGSAVKERLDSLLRANDMALIMPDPNTGAQIPPPPPPPPARKQRRHPTPLAPSGRIRYSYRYNVYPPGTTMSDSALPDVEAVFRKLQEMNMAELNFDWEDQFARLDSFLYMNAPDIRRRFGPVTEETDPWEEGEIIITNPDPANPNPMVLSIPKVLKMMPQNRPAGKGRYNRTGRDSSIRKLDAKARKIRDVIKEMAMALETRPAPIQQRINKKTLQSTLSKSFRDKGIDLPFEFAVYSPSSDSNRFPIRSAGFRSEYEDQSHHVSLFPNDLFHKSDMLMVYFPGQKSQVLRSLSWLLTGSILFTLIIVLTSGGSIIVMIRQKKISDIKTDFINNMTHEFKTPIATISIAADSINNPRVIAEPDTIRNFTRIIKEENNRMNTRVEQVLQMALLDSRDFKLRKELADLNHLIGRTVEHYRLQVERREGRLVARLEAGFPLVIADEDHLRNVLLNLLDNANKYSLASPDIEVFSFNRSGRYVFGVQDKGLGMSHDAQRKVFDKFYRVTSGNIHSIKGFGLGLSYVKAIVLAHQGEIRVHSEPGRGSRFEISLPLADHGTPSAPPEG